MVDFGRQINVRPAENSSAEREKLIARLKEHGRTLSSVERAEFYRDCVRHTNIKELLPLALEVTREKYASDSRLMIDWMSTTLSREEFWRVFETEGISGSSPNPSVWLECAKLIEFFSSHTEFIGLERKGKEIPIHAHPVGEEQYRLMRASPNMIARLSAAYYFPKSHTNPEFKALLAEAAKWKPPLTEDELKGDVRLLASNSFREREAAAQRLRGRGERGVAPLTKLLDSANDPETSARLKAIIEHGKSTSPTVGEEHFIKSLSANREENRQARLAILTALAQNDPAAHITQLAEKEFRELARFEESRAKPK
ncbi:hypothetical protein [Zavarzinella formosa]|uniref:hypothetical protein n=1 Tax=Zavarzinella formosa TaxID=360055 RepID=UPI001EE68A2A|nr:hypothetical protein [Zavarzinella formosa]